MSVTRREFAAGSIGPAALAFGVTALSKPAGAQTEPLRLGWPGIDLIAKAAAESGATDPDAFIGYWNALQRDPSRFGDYSFNPKQHNGYPTEQVVRSVANLQHEGAFALAPGYA